MSRVEKIEGEIRSLNRHEPKNLREWFDQYEAEVWDRQIEQDSKAGRLKALLERTLRDHEARRSTEL